MVCLPAAVRAPHNASTAGMGFEDVRLRGARRAG